MTSTMQALTPSLFPAVVRRIAPIVQLCPLAASTAGAQVLTGAIARESSDSSGAKRPRVPVDALNVSTGIHYRGETNSAGLYILTLLLTGADRLHRHTSGFRPLARTGLQLGTGQILRIDVALQVGSVNESITVSGQSPLLQTSEAAVGRRFDSSRVRNLPAGRTATNVLRTIAGVIPNPSGRSGTLADGNIHGGRGGATVMLTAKPGSNDFHGTLFYYFQNDKLNANAFFNNATGTALPAQRYNLFGAVASGPVMLPRVYDGHNRLFFTFACEGTRQIGYANTISSVPTQPLRAGDFSGLAALYDPATAVSTPSGFTVDLLLARQFPIGENAARTLRGEFGNAFNHFNPASPNTAIGNQNAGRITSTQTDARVIQISFRLRF